jgi:hypothetical protein
MIGPELGVAKQKRKRLIKHHRMQRTNQIRLPRNRKSLNSDIVLQDEHFLFPRLKE